jgi:hypothetical protein
MILQTRLAFRAAPGGAARPWYCPPIRGPAATARARRPLMPCGRCISLWRRHPRRPGHASAQQTLAHLYLLYCGHLTVPAVRPARPGGSACPGKPGHGAKSGAGGPAGRTAAPSLGGKCRGPAVPLQGASPPPRGAASAAPARQPMACPRGGQDSGCLSCSSAPDRPVKPGRNRRNRPASPRAARNRPGKPAGLFLEVASMRQGRSSAAFGFSESPGEIPHRMPPDRKRSQ